MNLLESENEKKWTYIPKLKSEIEKWSSQQGETIYKTAVIPQQKTIEVYIFYKKNKQLAESQTNGIVERTKDEIKNILEKLGYFNEFDDTIKFEFDTHENVKKNYKGNYFYRLR